MSPAVKKILILDDNTIRSSLLKNLINFIGLECHLFDFSSWLAETGSIDISHFSLVMIGDASDQISWEQLRPTLYSSVKKQLPVVELSNNGELTKNSIGKFTSPYKHEALLSLLYKANLYQRANNPKIPASDFCEDLVGESQFIWQIKVLISQVAQRDVNVMITGESGTGKEVVARALHKNSSRCDQPFVPVNCGAIPVDLLESELFGHEKGAFTGAITSRQGRFELAKGGTLFLDEIGDMPLNMQVKLLRVLQEKTFERVGGVKTLEADVRIITATHKNLEQMILENTFREDLFYRLNVFPIDIPPLRNRLEDIPLLISELLKRQTPPSRLQFVSKAMQALLMHPWAGNVRELANLLERLSITHSGEVISVMDLPSKFHYIEDDDLQVESAQINSLPFMTDKKEFNASSSIELNIQDETAIERAMLLSTDSHNEQTDLTGFMEQGFDLKYYLEHIELKMLEKALDESNQVVAHAARKLGIRRTTMVEKMKKYRIARL